MRIILGELETNGAIHKKKGKLKIDTPFNVLVNTVTKKTLILQSAQVFLYLLSKSSNTHHTIRKSCDLEIS